ncbi:Retrovirus-related Pol polyprotein from transposon opus [Thelohanellus kitauei]|uniref:Retrovirus-related Pol polyprotein from transposon opus n=1 Tax=Thelohanellus kitauei TaxID=669202 RepID=A0A0C2MZC1_THEKT|nr:Retrovirus-related Pol polyprotein from transposon opus [Thelohanellus kitauei]
MRKLSGGYHFSNIDLDSAYNQIALGTISQKRRALSTHKGVLLQKRLPFGIKSAPGYFQQIMNQLQGDLPGVAIYFDDILISGNNRNNRVDNLRAVLQRLSLNGLRCNQENCEFAKPEISYLGFTLSANGISKGPKASAIEKMPEPKNLTQLKSFL